MMNKYRKTNDTLDMIRGSMIGGAAGDALGYAIEFDREKTIFHEYGKQGITKYELDGGLARISDDTQMTLFTANGLLVGDTRMKLRGIGAKPSGYVAMAYEDWLNTQNASKYQYSSKKKVKLLDGYSWILGCPELYALRAPGGTCLSAMRTRCEQPGTQDFIQAKVNDSKGCGGIMRVAPIALMYRPGENFKGSIEEIDKEGAQIAAITHSHPLGYLPAAVVAHIISRILTDGDHMTLEEIVLEAGDTIRDIFKGEAWAHEIPAMLRRVVDLAFNDKDDLTNIHALGEGWVAEETMMIAIYCALKYQDDFSKALIVSVNHKGDSDSTGAVAGNILGAWVGYKAMEDKWKENLELSDVILELADDLYTGCPMTGDDEYRDKKWLRKYVEMKL